MFLLAWRQGRLDPVRTALTGLALGAVVAVILVLEGFERGLYYQLERSVLERGGDLIAVEPGVSNFLVGGSSLPQLARGEVEAVAGVAGAHPVTVIPVIYEKRGVRTPIMVFISDTKGGPARIVEGRRVTEDRDVVVDASLAALHGIRVGDPFIVSDFEFTVSGITERDAALFVPFTFISYEGMIDFFLDSEIAPDISTFPLLSFLLLDVEPGADSDRVAAAIEERVPSVKVFTPHELAREDANFGRMLFGPILGLLVAVGYVIGLLVAGLILYAEVAARLHSFAVLKALGFTFYGLAGAVVAQALLLLAIAVPIGLVLAQAVAALVYWAAPLYEVRAFEPAALLQTVAASLGFALAGALIALRPIRRLDPMVAFQRA
jgi:putative ABC transport system permease protein